MSRVGEASEAGKQKLGANFVLFVSDLEECLDMCVCIRVGKVVIIYE